MAKAERRKVANKPEEKFTERYPAKIDREIKKDGVSYRLIAQCEIKCQKPLPPGTIFRECNDGWFAVFCNDTQIHYRLGVKLVAEINSSLEKV